MIKRFLLFALVLLSALETAQGQIYTFKCVIDADSKELEADSCEGCVMWDIDSRSFDGLLIYLDSVPNLWIEIPYTLKVRGDTVDIWEHTSPPSRLGYNLFYPDRISITLAETNFATIKDFVDSTFCNALRAYQIDSTALWYPSDSINTGVVFRGDTLTIVGRDLAHVTFDSLLQKYVIQVDSVSGGGSGIDTVKIFAPAAGFTVTGSPGVAPVATFTFTLANDLAALEALATTGIVTRTAAESYTTRTVTAGTGAITVTNGDGVAGNPTINNTDPDQSTTNEIQTYGHAGTTTYTNTLSLGGGTWSITGAGIAAISNTAGAITVTATEVDGSISNELQTIANTSNATTHTATLSNSGGSLQFAEGAGISLTTTGTGLDGILTIASTLTNFYQLFRDDGVAATQRAAANFVSSVRIATTLTDDAGNGETEVSHDLVLNSVADAYLSQRGALTVMGRAVNSTGNVADIVSTADGQVLRRNGTTLDWGQVGTTWLANQAVTYVKIQNAVANNVLLGNNNGANTSFEELDAAAAQTMLGYIDGTGLAAQRIAYGSDANTIKGDAAWLYDDVNDRITSVAALPGLGAGAAMLNLSNTGPDGTGEFLQIRGDISGNLLWGSQNTNTGAGANSILYVSQAGNSAGDAFTQYNITGTSGSSAAVGIDNSDANKLKFSPNSTTPGGSVNNSFVGTNDAITLYGVGIDNPARRLDVGGDARAINHVNTNAPPTSSAIGNGIGTGGTVDAITGGNNGFTVTFTTGTGCVLDGPMFRLTYANAFTTTSHVIIDCHRDVDSIAECDKFLQNNTSPGFIDLKANGTLTDSKTHILRFIVIGQ